jgi:membrane protease YdiL (CAAX protease family)
MQSVESHSPETPHPYLWRWKDLIIILLGIAGIFTVGFILYGLWGVLRGADPNELAEYSISFTLGIAALEAIALIGGIYIFGIRRRGLNWRSVGLRPVTKTWLVITTVASLIVIPLTSLLILLVYFVFGLELENPQLDFLLPEQLTSLEILAMLFLAGVAAPFGEELLFRGVFYKMLRERWGIWPGVLISSLVFGMIHGDLAVGLTAFLLGILLALVFEYSRSLWTSILVHALNNSIKIGLFYLLVELGFPVGS